MNAKKWIVAEPDTLQVRSLAAGSGLPTLAAAVLCARGIDTPQLASEFLNSKASSLLDPMELAGMPDAVKTIRQAIENKERIAVFGDYDVDGVTATCVLTRYLRREGADCVYYIPDRLSEGYGLNTAALKGLRDGGVSLVVTVDSGITALPEIAYAVSIGLKIVVTDHHECKNDLPAAAAVVNPRQACCPYPFKELAGVGVAFKLICALAGPNRQSELLMEYADLVAVGTIADVMPLVGENRIIVHAGLKRLMEKPNLGLQMLMREAGVIDRKMTSAIVSFTLAPRINAAGRLGCAGQAAELFLTENPHRAQELASLLCQENKDRQNRENEILQQAFDKLRGEYNPEQDKMIVLWGENWHHGVIGIVSSRISDRYCCPTVLISLDGDTGKGSGRSIHGFNLFEALEHSAQYLTKYGGHELAAGLSITRQNLDAFKRDICSYAAEHVKDEDLIPQIKIDCRLKPEWITEENVESISVLEPFGSGNPQPIFCLENMMVEEITPISSDRHIKMLLSKEGCSFTAMLFGTGSTGCGFAPGNLIDAAFQLEINEFRGRRTVQLLLRDVRLARPEIEKDQLHYSMYHRYMNGEGLTEDEIHYLLPDRPDLVAVWRHINSQALENKLSVPFGALSRRVQWESKRNINIGKLFVCLDVFSESQLLSYHYKEGLLHIRLLRFEGKADISKSVVLSTLKKMNQH